MAAMPALLTLTSPLGEGVLTAIGLHAEEAIDTPFSYTVEMVGQTESIDPNDLLSHPATVELDTNDGPSRYFHGIVRSFVATGGSARQGWSYRMQLVPRLWFASQTEDCRVFHKKTSEDIIRIIFEDNKISPATFKISGTLPTREYTVQYNETDLNFITRLMQEDGISYFFEHSVSDHTIVLFNTAQAFSDLDEATFHFVPGGEERDVLASWQAVNETAIGRVAVLDYEPLTPATPVRGEAATLLKTSGSTQRDVVHWPALHLVSDAAAERARRLQEAAEAHAERHSGRGANPLMQPGRKFRLVDEKVAFSLAGSFVIQSVVHAAVGNPQVSGNEALRYHNTFTAFPAAAPWQPVATVARPLMAGIFSAVVVGKDGEEIDVDEHGRIKVRLLWDHRGDSTADVTLPVRVMQPWSGNQWGWQHIPRVGSEVAVAFVDGDPDRPLVVGGLYNGEQAPPFPLASRKTKTGLRTRSSPGGGSDQYSEFSFDDAAGSELACLRAQKDFTVDVLNDNTVTIKGKQKIKVTQGRTTVIEQGGDKLTVQTGDLTVDTSSGAIKLTAMQSLELVVGASKVKLDQTGITVSGMMVTIEGTVMMETKAPMHTVKGEGMLMVKGGMVMVN